MKQHERDDEFANTILLPFPSKEPNSETLEAIREGHAFLATGESGRFDKVDFQSQRNSLNGPRVSAANATRK